MPIPLIFVAASTRREVIGMKVQSNVKAGIRAQIIGVG